MGNDRFKALVAAVVLLCASGCSRFDEPEALKTGAYEGCYADGDVVVQVSPEEIRVNGKAFPYRIEQRTIGVGVVAPMSLKSDGREVTAIRADDHFYRFLDKDHKRRLIMTDDFSNVYDMPSAPCRENL